MAQAQQESSAVSPSQPDSVSAGFDPQKAAAVYTAWRMVKLTRAAGTLDFEERVHEFERLLEEFLR